MNVTPNIPANCLNSRQMIRTDKTMSLLPIKDDPTLKRIAVLSYNSLAVRTPAVLLGRPALAGHLCFGVNLPRVQPINPTQIAAAFDHKDWIFELKHDGFRAVAYVEGETCQLISRKNIIYICCP
jgi:ATP-dependent DNA ligase